MTTTSDRLALLQRTKAGQRALLEEMYPDLDFNTVPFREYGRLFTGRKYVPGFVGGWKTYGRSNEDADRDILYDYSGNGRDIKLYNFAFSGMSGYGGYGQDFNNLTPNSGTGLIIEQNSTYTKVQNINSGTGNYSASIPKRLWNNIAFRLNVIGSDSNTNPRLIFRNSDASFIKTIKLSEGLNIIEPLSDTEWQQVEYIWFALSPGATVGFELLPLYPGALVSDGIDDYGQCIKGFSLPDDYTIVAIRRIIEGNSAALASKGASKGAFLFEVLNNTNKSGVLWSYGQTNTLTDAPDLFSYQSKASYNGREISYGTAEDSMDDAFTIFRHSAANHMSAALFDKRIYDHTLTAEELEAVMDDMMTDYENATGGGIADIHYVADWDGKGRSNDEEEPMRSQWVDKSTGKVIELHNYAYAGMSGWGGYGIDSSRVVVNGPYDRVDGNVLQFNAIKNAANFLYPVSGMKSVSMKIMVDGISRAVTSGKANYLQIYFSSSGGERLQITGDGVHEVDLPVTEGSQWMYLYVAPGVSAPDWLPIDPVTVEILPSYPGALVNDGVDDYGLTQEAIDEEVGTMVLYGRLVDESLGGYYILNTNASLSGDGRLYIWRGGSGTYGYGLPAASVSKSPIVLTRNPLAPATPMYIASSGPGYYSACIIYRIILIREQLDGAQVEFLKWKVEKDYRDWCRDNGYEYAINQLTA